MEVVTGPPIMGRLRFFPLGSTPCESKLCKHSSNSRVVFRSAGKSSVSLCPAVNSAHLVLVRRCCANSSSTRHRQVTSTVGPRRSHAGFESWVRGIGAPSSTWTRSLAGSLLRDRRLFTDPVVGSRRIGLPPDGVVHVAPRTPRCRTDHSVTNPAVRSSRLSGGPSRLGFTCLRSTEWRASRGITLFLRTH